MSDRRRPSLIDLDSSDEEYVDSYETPNTSPDDDFVPRSAEPSSGSNTTTPNTHDEGMMSEDDDLVTYNQQNMDVQKYGLTLEQREGGPPVRRSQRVRNRPITRRKICSPSQHMNDGCTSDGTGKNVGDDDARIDGEWLGSNDSESDEEDAESFYQKYPDMRNFVVSDSDEDRDEDYTYTTDDASIDDDDEDFTYTMQGNPNPNATRKATSNELARLLKPQRCKKSDESTQCAICLEHLKCRQVFVALPACQHRFHLKCIKPWLLNRNRQCPTCRKDVAARL